MFWEILMWLVIGVLLGIIAGWLLCRLFYRREQVDSMQINDSRLTGLQSERDKATSALHTSEANLAKASADLDEAQKALAACNERCGSLQDTVVAHEATIADLSQRLDRHETAVAEGGGNPVPPVASDTSSPGALSTPPLPPDQTPPPPGDSVPSVSAAAEVSAVPPESDAADDIAKGSKSAPKKAGSSASAADKDAPVVGVDTPPASSDDPEEVEDAIEAEEAKPGNTPDTPSKPSTAAAASDGPDDLTRIKGIGKVLSGKLHDLGITTFAQIAAFTPEDVERVNDQLSFKGRIEREEWIAQAKKLAGGD